ncbi:MAG: hypothetical protein JWR16_1212 [Nevskia sp.]|nr:hypothetical protein [Nevskia sp.]
MTDPIQGVTPRLALMALDAYELRQRVIANNIANADSVGYRPMRVNFESQLQALQSAARSGASAAELGRLADRVRPAVEFRSIDNRAEDTSARLDDEMAAMVQNTMQYEAVITALERIGDLTSLALGGAA